MIRKDLIKELEGYIEELKTIKLKQTNDPATFLKIEKNICYLNNGKRVIREQIKKQNKEGSAVIILPITKEGEVLLVVEPRLGCKRTVSVGLPAGYIENGEEPLLAAKRELEEETGYTSFKYQLLAKYYQDPAISAAYNYAYVAFDAEKTKDQALDPGEFIRYLTCKYEEALKLVELGYIEDLQAQFVLEKAKTFVLTRI